MKPFAAWGFALTLLTLLNGCATLMPGPLASDDQIQEWISDQHFAKAIDALTYRNNAHPSVKSKENLDAAVAKAEQYDHATAANALKHQTQGDWAGAFALVSRGLAHYPDGKELRAARDTLHQRQKQRLDELEMRRLLAKAQWLAQTAPVLQEMARIDPDDLTVAWQVKHVRENSVATAATLSQIGVNALQQNNLKVAERCLTAADRLHFSESTSQALAQVAQLRAQSEAKERQLQERIQQAIAKTQQMKEEKQQRQRTQMLTAQMQQALDNTDLAKAKELLAQLTEADEDNPDLAYLKRALSDAISAKVHELKARGDTLYSRGQIERAKATWSQALDYAPDNTQIRFRIDRATRVLEKLKQLQKRPANRASKTTPST